MDRSIAKLLKSPRKLRIELHDEDADGDTAGVAIDRPKLLTEVGNGRRLIETYGRNIRYCPKDDCWLYFGGKVWLKDKRTVHVHDLMKRVLIQMQQEAFCVLVFGRSSPHGQAESRSVTEEGQRTVDR